MWLPEDDPCYLVTDDQPACQVEGTVELLNAGVEGFLNSGPMCAPVRLSGYCLRWAPLMPCIAVSN